MNILPNVVASLNKEEIRSFKLFINRTNSNKNRKDENLFDLIKNSYPDKYDEEKLFKKLYGAQNDKNSYYRLKNRLLEDIGISLSQFYFNETDLHYILNHYLLCKTFSLKNEWQSAKFYITKAEKKAESIEHYQMLDLIYSELISLSHEILEIDPDDYIKKRHVNRSKLADIQELDDILATIIYKVRKTQNFSGPDVQLSNLLKKYTDSEEATKNKIKTNKQFKFKLYEALSRVLLSKKDYKALEDYLLSTFADFTKHNLFNKNTHNTNLQMLAYITNALFMNGKYSESLKYADKLRLAMLEFDKLHYDKYVFFYYNALVNNFSKTDPIKALEPLNEAKENKAITKHPFYVGYIYLNLGVTYYNLQDYKPALKSFIKLYTNSNYSLLDETFRFNVSVAELMIRYLLNDKEYVISKISQIQKDFKSVTKQPVFTRDNEFIKLLLLMANSENAKSQKLDKSLSNFKESDHKNQSNEILNYDEFLDLCFNKN